jgi:pyruvate kinase
MTKLTKIVATLGPATETAEVMEKLINAGMDVARFNTKHGTPEWHLERIHRVKAVAKKLGKSVAVLLDLQGPEIRINTKDGASFDLKAGDTAKFVSTPAGDREMNIPANVIEALQIGDTVSTDDGACEYKVIEKDETSATVQSVVDITVKHRKTMNTPGIVIDMPSLIENDLIQLDNMTDDDIDFVGLSFVRDTKDIAILRDELKKRNLHTDIVAKIENQSALDNLDEIIEASDAVMVARGDLAVEVPFEGLAHYQKMIIEKCRTAGKPVITATQMLKSMTSDPRPTRAEVSDVANAIYDGTDAVMLSEETTIGKYPVECVETQARIAAYNEPFSASDLWDWADLGDTSAITFAAFSLLDFSKKDIDLVVCFTASGATARQLSRFRPDIKIKALTYNRSAYNKLSLVYGVEPVLVTDETFIYSSELDIVNNLKANKIVEVGQKVLITAGLSEKVAGRKTDSLLLVEIK